MNLKFLKLQSILLFVPFLNFAIFFIWAINQLIVLKHFSLLRTTVFAGATIVGAFALVAIEMNIFRVVSPQASYAFILYYIEGLTMGTLCLLSQKLELQFFNKVRGNRDE